MSYCVKCGTEKKDEFAGSYDVDTGKRLMKQVCSNDSCKDRCEHFGHVWKQRGWLERLMGGDLECIKCGYVPFARYP